MVRFPDPKQLLKQWEEWHIIVSSDQLVETLVAAPTQLNKRALYMFVTALELSLLSQTHVMIPGEYSL